ncbi:FAD-dependent oxidoreductase [Serratia fonticola]|uniref:FAD-dependent oxidoreductase n=1 Tax=Serratia fonticola TaxID=47917 RepID=UPI00217A02E4|nr:FAD-dependent oxidoreductase [Serratia fonticola]CAI1863821.1 Electron transfer flavoprotein-ubiquinone oxidoreductase [Serratia fonticola]CAI1918297.1 Electron transfer flavoprotein-ubiquinone oxidoreductase [Serratia fonticola]CAI2024639.1 Electron transfer flavoprotein-ubiquinone oxidoreductase [Serratia fonticola]
MEHPGFAAIIVGGGVAGCTAALLLARAGINTLLLERGTQPGSKNVSGGRLYTHVLANLLPNFAATAPLERHITQERLSMVSGNSAVTLDYHHTLPCSYSLLRARFDPWLMAQAEAAGAQCLTGALVDELIVQQGRVVGVMTAGEALYANTVILAEGANTLLGEQAGLQPMPPAATMAIGVKEVLALPRERLEDRFALEDNQGCAWLFAGQPTQGKIGGGFLYTNRDSLSLGVVCNLSSLTESKIALPQMLQQFKQHPAVRPLLKNTELREYSAHLIPEGGAESMPPLFGPGYLLVGDAARLCINTGHTVRGMDLAMLSAQAAAETLIAGQELQHYPLRLQQSSLWALIQQYRRLPEMMLKSPHWFSRYPQLAADVLQEMFEVNGNAPTPLRKLLWRHARRIGLKQLLKDTVNGMRSL